MSLVQPDLQPSKHSCPVSLVNNSTSSSNASHGEDNIHSSNVSLSNASTATCNQSVVQSLANDGSYGREVLRLPTNVSSECTAALFSPRNIEVDQLKNNAATASAIRSLVTFPLHHEPDATSIRTASTLLAESPVPPLTPDNCSVCDDCADEERTRALKLALELKTIRNLKPEHDAVRARFFLHQSKQTESLRNSQDLRRKRLQESHRSSVESLEDQHTVSLNLMEERQLEEELRVDERQQYDYMRCALRLRHLRDACYGITSTNGRVVTAQDLSELQSQQYLYDKIRQKQEDEIRILRAQQDRRLQARAACYKFEVNKLQTVHEQELAEMGKEFELELGELRVLYERRMQRLMLAWDQPLGSLKVRPPSR